jgi:hypothetical protein
MGPDDELEEAIEKAHAPFERRVGATIGIIAAALAAEDPLEVQQREQEILECLSRDLEQPIAS